MIFIYFLKLYIVLISPIAVIFICTYHKAVVKSESFIVHCKWSRQYFLLWQVVLQCQVTLFYVWLFINLQCTSDIHLIHLKHQHSHTRPNYHLNVKLNISHKVLQISVVNDRGSEKSETDCSLFQAFQLLL